jgi:hypothetical protein
MPYFDATPAVLQRMFGIADTDLPDDVLVLHSSSDATACRDNCLETNP